MAQFIMVTLRKVSLTLADHHIGITHAGNGCSQRITDFDRAAALDLSDEIEAEERARAESEAEKEAMPELPSPSDMPKTPEPLPTPSSLGGLADRAGADVHAGGADAIDEIQGGFQSLIERSEEASEGIQHTSEASTVPPDETIPTPEIEATEEA